MTHFDQSQEQMTRKPGADSTPGETGALAAAPVPKRAHHSRQIWTRADGFTMSGPRRV